MEPDQPPPEAETRLSDVGDVEMFDGERWFPVASLLDDAQDANRDGPDARPFPGAGGSGPAGS